MARAATGHKLERTRHPGIYRKGNRYVVRYRHRGQPRKSSQPNLASALAFQADVRSGVQTPASRARFEDYARDWLDSYNGRTRRGLGDLTRADYRRSMENRVLPAFARYKLADVEPPDVRRFVTALEREGLKPSTVRGIVAPLRAMYATALEDGAVRANPTVGVRIAGRVDEGDEQPRAMTTGELSELLAEVPEDWRLFFEFLAHTGLRISEAIGLTWSAIEFGARPRVRVTGQLCRGKARGTKSANGRRDPAAVSRNGAPPVGSEHRHGPRRPCVRHPYRDRPQRPQRGQPGAEPSPAACRPRVGDLPHVPAHLRVGAPHPREDDPAGVRLARPRGPVVHAQALRAPHGRRARERRLPRRSGRRRFH